MAILVLAVGAVMFVAGAAEIFYGTGMIEIERGWSAFIAGSVLLTGGVLTMALGLAVRALLEVKGVLRQLGGLADAGAGAFRPEIAAPAREPVPLREAEPAMQLDGPGLQIEPHFGTAPAAAIEAAEIPPLRLRDEPARSPPPAAPPAPSAPETPQAEAADDWLEQEFADIRREAAMRHGVGDERNAEREGAAPDHAAPAAEAAASPAVHPAGHPAVNGDIYADYVELAPAAPPAAAEPPQAASPAAAIAAPPAPPPAPPQSAVIGRYEADGTSYVMFADGSIEAQSEAGVYRFASMAELKSFIET